MRVLAEDLGAGGGGMPGIISGVKRIAAIALALLLGVILAGGHLALLQGVAWASMLVSRAGSGSLATAVVTTFDGRHPCGLCQALERHEHDAGPAKPAPDLAAMKLKLKAECVLPLAWRGPPPAPVVATLDGSIPSLADRAADSPPLPPPIRS